MIPTCSLRLHPGQCTREQNGCRMCRLLFAYTHRLPIAAAARFFQGLTPTNSAECNARGKDTSCVRATYACPHLSYPEHRTPMHIYIVDSMHVHILLRDTPPHSPAVPVMTPTSAAIIKNLPSSAVSSGSSHACRCSLCTCSLPHLIDRKGGPAADDDAGSAASLAVAPAGVSVTAGMIGRETAAGPPVESLAAASSRPIAPLLPCLGSAVATRVRSNKSETGFLCSGARARDMAAGCRLLVEDAAAELRRMLELRQPLRGAVGRHKATALCPLLAVLAARAQVEIKYVSRRKQIADAFLLPNTVSIFSLSLTPPRAAGCCKHLPEEPYVDRQG